MATFQQRLSLLITEIGLDIKALQTTQSNLNQFDYLVTKFSKPPTLNTTTSTGKVFNYTLEEVTRYRFVPTIYNPTQDAFYSTFTGGVLSGLITKRG